MKELVEYMARSVVDDVNTGRPAVFDPHRVDKCVANDGDIGLIANRIEKGEGSIPANPVPDVGWAGRNADWLVEIVQIRDQRDSGGRGRLEHQLVKRRDLRWAGNADPHRLVGGPEEGQQVVGRPPVQP